MRSPEPKQDDAEKEHKQEKDVSAVDLAVIDVVNPRLAKYPRACCMAVTITVLQSFLIVGGVAAYRCFGGEVRHFVMDQEIANSKETWENPEMVLLGSSVTYGGDWWSRWWGIVYASSPDWRFYDKNYTERFRKAFDEGGRFGFASAVDAVFLTKDLPGRLVKKEFVHWLLHEGGYMALTFPCQVEPIPCKDYGLLPNGHRKRFSMPKLQRESGFWDTDMEDCDPNLLCWNLQSTVTVTVLKKVGWAQCLANALALLSYAEVLITMMVLWARMSYDNGPCWFRNKALLTDYMRATSGSTTTQEELKLLHENA